MLLACCMFLTVRMLICVRQYSSVMFTLNRCVFVYKGQGFCTDTECSLHLLIHAIIK